jgi:FxsC-like protein
MSLTDPGRDRSRQAPRGTYFYLSYAHSTLGYADDTGDTDHWVTVFFNDLARAVREVARFPVEDPGFYDALLPPGNWKADLTKALSATEVFVPLYSTGYLDRTWPMGERQSFLQRLPAATAKTDPHVVPVLWAPLPDDWSRVPELPVALELGHDMPSYLDNGLRALCMLPPYREHYRSMVSRLARRIVDIAELSPLGSNRVPAFGDIAGSGNSDDTPFIVGVLAPTTQDLPTRRSAETYGVLGQSWRPFGAASDVPVAEYAANYAERLGLTTRIIDFNPDRELLDRFPGMIIVDPWIMLGDGGRSALGPIGVDLRNWVTVLVVADADDPQYAEHGAELRAAVTEMLTRAGAPRVQHANGVAEFERLMPRLVTEVRRRYLRNAPTLAVVEAQRRRPTLTDGLRRTDAGGQNNV